MDIHIQKEKQTPMQRQDFFINRKLFEVIWEMESIFRRESPRFTEMKVSFDLTIKSLGLL